MALFTGSGPWQRPSSHPSLAGPRSTVPAKPPDAIPCFSRQPPTYVAPDDCQLQGPPLPPPVCLTSRQMPPYFSTTHGTIPHPLLLHTTVTALKSVERRRRPLFFPAPVFFHRGMRRPQHPFLDLLSAPAHRSFADPAGFGRNAGPIAALR
jgi:hypothetical protein